MRLRSVFAGAFLSATSLGLAAHAKYLMFEDFSVNAMANWVFVTDGVMGGVSDGRAETGTDGNKTFMHLTGTVSTENNGGFIQVRRQLADTWSAQTDALALDVRGNGRTYYVFLRTKEMTRHWQHYRSAFKSGSDWLRINLPLDAFKRSDNLLSSRIDPQSVISIGLVAYGRDHVVDLSVASIALLSRSK